MTACLDCSRWQPDESTRSFCIPVTPKRSCSTSRELLCKIPCEQCLADSATYLSHAGNMYRKRMKAQAKLVTFIPTFLPHDGKEVLVNPQPAVTCQTKKRMNQVYVTVWGTWIEIIISLWLYHTSLKYSVDPQKGKKQIHWQGSSVSDGL